MVNASSPHGHVFVEKADRSSGRDIWTNLLHTKFKLTHLSCSCIFFTGGGNRKRFDFSALREQMKPHGSINTQISHSGCFLQAHAHTGAPI